MAGQEHLLSTIRLKTGSMPAFAVQLCEVGVGLEHDQDLYPASDGTFRPKG